MSVEREIKEEMRRTKRKVKRVGLTWLIILIFVPILFIGYHAAMVTYEMYVKERRLEISNSPNQEHTIEVVEKGAAFFFGPSSVRIKYQSKHQDSQIANDGAALDSSNVSITWESESCAVVTLYGDEQEPEERKVRLR